MNDKHKVAKRLKDYTATAINTSCEVYKKVIANEDEGRDGAVEKAIKDLYIFLDNYRNPDIFNHKGIHRLKGLNFFSGLDKSPKEETIKEYTRKYITMMIRKDIMNGKPLDKVWGTKRNVENAIRYYFNNENCFVMEGTNEKDTNILKEGFTSDGWQINGSHLKDSPLLREDAGLINIKGIRLVENALLKTSKNIIIENKYNEDGIYSLHLFIKCLVKDEIKECIEITLKHKTKGEVFKKKYKNTLTYKWENIREYVRLPNGEYTIEIKGKKPCDLDFISIFPSVQYPSVSFLIGHGGTKSGNYMFFAPGSADKITNKAGELVFTEQIKQGTHEKYKFWYPSEDDTVDIAKNLRETQNIKLDDKRWGYWAEDGSFANLAYLPLLLETLIPVGVKVFDIVLTKRG